MATTGNPVNRLIWLLSKSAHTPITLEVAACVEALARWAFENVVGHDCLPKALPTEFSSILSRRNGSAPSGAAAATISAGGLDI